MAASPHTQEGDAHAPAKGIAAPRKAKAREARLGSSGVPPGDRQASVAKDLTV